MSQLFGHDLDLLAPLWNLAIDSLVLNIKSIEVVGELLGHVGCLAENLTRECFDLLDASRSARLLFNREVISKLILVLLPQKVNEELATTKHFGLHDTRHEFLIINFFLLKLLARQFLFLVNLWKRRDYNLRVLSNQVVPKLHKVDVKSLNFPSHGIRSHHNHQGLSSHHLADLRRDQLINAANKKEWESSLKHGEFESKTHWFVWLTLIHKFVSTPSCSAQLTWPCEYSPT